MIELRAEAAHFQPDYPLDLRAQARQRAQAAQAEAAKALQQGLSTASGVTAQVSDALDILGTNPALKTQLAAAKDAVKGVQGLIGKVQEAASLAERVASSPHPLMALLNEAPGLADKYLPGLLPDDVQQALTMASRLASMSTNPTVLRSLPGMDALRSTRGGTTADLLIDGAMNLISGQPFDQQRFLSGALTAVSKDLLHRAMTIEEDS